MEFIGPTTISFLEKGRQEGLRDGHREVALRLLSRGSSVGDVADLCELSTAEVELLQAQMPKQIEP